MNNRLITIRRHRLLSRTRHLNWILIGFGFGIFYWLLESVRDASVFHQGPLLHQIFLPDPMTFWMRMLVVWILILFGSYAQSFKEDERTRIKASDEASDPLIMASLIFGAAYWILESLRDNILQSSVPSAKTLIQTIFYPEPLEFWMRLLAVFLLFLFGLYAQTLWNKQRKALKAARESEERLSQIIQQMPYPVLICDPDGLAVEVNQATLRLFEVDADAIIKKYNLFKDEKWSQSQSKEIASRLRQGETISVPKCILEKGSRYLSRSLERTIVLEGIFFPVNRTTNTLWRVVVIWRDVTDQLSAEEEKEKIQAQLLQAQKMEAIGILAGGVAHDFNNLLTAIQGSADLALLDTDTNSPNFKELRHIKTATSRATDLTKQLLLFSRKHLMGFSMINMNQCIENLLTLIRRLIGENIQIQTHLNQDLWAIKADKGTLEQVIMNLVVNARDAMPHGGRLTLTTDNITLNQEMCQQFTNAVPGNYIRISITDTGFGMDKETMQHIFEPFFSTKEPGQGTGLGLSVVYGIIKQHEGWINVYSEPGIGSTFRIYLPGVKERAESLSPKQMPSLKSLQGNGERILVVEDDMHVRNFITGALDRSGYQVLSAETYDEALSLFKSEKKNFQLVLSDVVLPDRSGIEMVEALIRLNPNLRVLLGSGYMDDKSQWPVIQERGYRFIPKPYDLMELLKTLRETLESRPHTQTKSRKRVSVHNPKIQ